MQHLPIARRVGWSEEQEVAETTLLIGHYMMTARFLETLEIDMDREPTPWTGMTAKD
jgi:hypothetical protein